MAAFGGFCPLPIPLGPGDGPETGWTAAQHAALCRDVVAIKRTGVIARIRFSQDATSSAITVHSFHAQPETGITNAPTFGKNGGGDWTLTFASSYDDDSERARPFMITGAICGIAGTAARVAQLKSHTATTATIYFSDTTDEVSVHVFGTWWEHEPRIGHYDGALDKADSDTEGRTPYAWTFYSEAEAALGDAFTRARSTNVHALKLAIARCLTGAQRSVDKVAFAAQPATSYETLGQWQEALRVRLYPEDTPQDVRQRCAGRFKAATMPTRANTDAALETLLGDAFVRTWHRVGSDLANPPAQTYWPGVNPGTSNYSLGGGSWFSERAHLTIEVKQTPGQSNASFLHTMNVDLFDMVDSNLPAYATVNWALDVQNGFLLDISKMDYTGFGS